MPVDALVTALQTCQHLTQPAAAGPPWWVQVGLTPFFGALFAAGGAWIGIQFDRRKALNQELIKKRIEIYDVMAPKLNDLYCFFHALGAWKTLPPPLMLSHKRDLDRTLYVYKAFFSDALVKSYHDYINACFETFTGQGKAARLRASRDSLVKDWQADWESDWDVMVAAVEDAEVKKNVGQLYDGLLSQFANEIGAT